MRWPLQRLLKTGASVPTDLKRFEFIAYFVGAYVADVVLKSRRKDMSPEEIAMIVDRALDNLRGRDGGESNGQRHEDAKIGPTTAL
jgi:hypothetical protein